MAKVICQQSLIKCRRQHLTGLLNRGGMADLPFFRTLLAIHQKSQEPGFWEVMDSCFISICKFDSFKNLSAMITSLSELYFRIRRFILLIQMKKKVISMCYCQYTKMGSNNNDIPDGLSVVDKYVQIAINKLHLLKYFNN